MQLEFPQGDIDIQGDKVKLLWEDGRQQQWEAAFLRSVCPCATCRNAKFDVTPSMFPGVIVEGASLVGAYAIQFEFSDGHSTGAYPYTYLLDLPDDI